MKEGFSIFYALRKMGISHSILTDHENLTRLRTEHSANKMVSRWFVAYQEFDIIERIHVKGMDNDVPDSFSRLCSNICAEGNPVAITALFYQITGCEMEPQNWEAIRLYGHGNESGHGHCGVSRTIG